MDALLKFITCGSVDDGKSTLIGHMLYDAKLLFSDQKQMLQMESKTGSRGGEIDYSLLLDGLMAEREQGITIDVAYRYFATEKRSFIVADTPGHEEYTRNMAVGASFADLAIILVDASQGVLIQTRRHTRICSLMGIKHFVFAINKMDLVDYREESFKRIEKDIKILMAEINYKTAALIPVSATEGDNITNKNPYMTWYQGPSLLHYLEEIDVSKRVSETGFTMPVQRVCRPNTDFRGFQGQIESGKAKVGDEITVLPSGETAVISAIYDGDTAVNESSVGHAVTIQLASEVDISRGCVLSKGAGVVVNSIFQAVLLWMDNTKLVAGKNYILKLGTQTVPATVMKIKYKLDINTNKELYADVIYKNEIVLCEIATSSKIVLDRFENNNTLGSLILIDRITHTTSACGVVEKSVTRGTDLTWHTMDITKQFREKQLGQRARTIWFTGLSGAGKSTLANEIEKRLVAMGKHTMLLDGDNIRFGLSKNLGFQEADRIENIRRIAEVAKLMNDAGLLVLTSFISPFVRDRKQARSIIGEDFIEVYVSTPLTECERRDPKGLYVAARQGNIADFTGVSSPYEEPENPDITVDTSRYSVEECADMVFEKLKLLL